MTFPDRSPAFFQHIVDARPVNGEQQCLCAARRLRRRTGTSLPARVARQFFEFGLAVRVAEHHVVARSREDRSELATHQARTKNPNPHVRLRCF